VSILRAESIFKSYTDTQKRVEVLKGVGLEVSAGDSVAVVGPSGAGKSTLLHILGGLDEPDQGRVFLDERDIYAMNDAARAGVRSVSIGFVFQFYHLLPELNALENVMLPVFVSSRGRVSMAEMRSRAKVALERVGLGTRLDHKPNQLSGGEQQRVAISRALVNEPQLLLCDEPTGNLDSKTGEEVIRLLLNLSREKGRTLVIVTHDEGIARCCSRTIHMKDGLLGPGSGQGEIK
jgi:predicted ABC-type transport system involved in lysophospholipase L1 biosynthesis ATPase subunit